MANYILGVDNSSGTATYKLYNATTTIEDPVTEVATINGLADDLIAADATEPIACPASITVTPGESDSYTVTLGTDALPASGTVSTTSTSVTLKLDNSITKYDADGGTPELNFTDGVKVQRTPTSAWAETSGTVLTFTVGTPVTLATISGLANTAAAANVKLGSVDGAGAFTEGTGTVIQLDTGALGNSDVTFTTNTGSYTLALASTVLKTKTLDSYEITITADTEDATATVLGQYKTYYTEGTDSDAGKKIAYHSAEKDDENSPAAKITGLKKSAVRGTDIIFGVDTDVSDKTITLKESALIKEADKAVVLTSSAFTFNLDAVTKSGTDYSTPEVTFPESKDGSATITTTPNAGWERSNNNKTITYKEPEAVPLANISGLADDADTTSVTVNATGTVTLQQAALAKEENTPATIEDESNTTKYKDVKFVFKLDNVDAPGTKAADGTVTGSTIAIDIDDINTGEATVVQTFQKGWTLDESDSKTVTYKAEVPVTLATITGLKTDATAAAFDVSKLISDKTVTLKQAALTEVGKPEAGETDARITLTPNTEALTGNESKYKSYNYTAADLKYGLALQSGTNGVRQTETNNGTTVIAVVKKDTETTTDSGTGETTITETGTATAYLAHEKLEYWTADQATGAASGDPNTVITYHLQGMSENGNDVLATVTGLKKDATVAKVTKAADEATATESVIFNTNAKTVTLKADALLTDDDDLVSGITTVALTGSGGYKLAIGNDVDKSGQIPAEDADDHDPAPNVTKLTTDNKVTIEQALTKGWALDNTSTTLTYSEPENDVLATITIAGVKNDANANDITIDDTDATKINIGASILDATKQTSVSIENHTIEGKTYNTYALALAADVDESGEDDGTAYVVITDAGQGEPTGTKTAKVMQDLTGGWSIPTEGTNAGKIIYTPANTDNVLATVTGLNSSLTNVARGGTASTDVTLGKDDDDVVLTKAALPKSADGGDTVTLTNSTGNEYSLALDEDDTTFEDYDTKPGTTTVKDSEAMTITNGKATITATLNEGWTLEGNTITYTAPATNTTLAEITGLNTTKATYTAGDDDNTVDFTITTDPDATTIAEPVITLKTDALTTTNVTLTNKTDLDRAAFTLNLQTYDEDKEEYVDVEGGKYGYEPTYAWTDDSTGTGSKRVTIASYRTSTTEGWTLDTTEDSPTKGTKITYEKETLAKDSNTILATVKGLKDGFTINNDYTYKDSSDETKTIAAPAIGMGTGANFVAGLYVTAEPEGTNAGTIYIAKNVLNTNTANPVTLEDGEGKYTFSLDDTDTKANEDLFVPTNKDATRNIWAVSTVAAKSPNPKSTTATYKTVTPEYWTLANSGDDNGKKITYTAQADKANGTLATITGLADGITVKDFDVVDPDDADKTIKVSKLVNSSGTPVANLGAFVGENEDAVFTTEDVLIATQNSEDSPVVLMLDKGALTTMNVTFTAGVETYDLAINDAESTAAAAKVTAPVFGSYKWTVSKGTATYIGNVTTAGYTLSADKKDTVKYTKTGNTDLATIAGLDSTVVVNNTNAGNQVGTKVGSTFTQGIKVGTTTVGEGEGAVTYDSFELKDNVLGTTTVTVTNTDTDIRNYKLALDADVMDSEDPEIGVGVNAWRVEEAKDGNIATTTATYGELTPAYYTLDATAESPTTYLTKITYTEESEGTVLAKITGLKAGLTLTDSTYEDNDGTELRTSVIDGITFDEDDEDVIKLTEAVLATNDGKVAELTEGSYTLALDDVVDAVEINTDAAMSWNVASVAATQTAPATKTATLKGATTAGWTLDDTAKKVTYTAAKTGQEFVTITGLNNSVNATKLKAMSAKLPEDGTFVLTEDLLTNSDVTITSGTLPNGKDIVYEIDETDSENPVKVQYGIALAEPLRTAAETAVEGEERWYFDPTDTNKTTLTLANIHDAHYVSGKLATGKTDKLEADSFEKDPYTITYVEEIKDDFHAKLTNLASGLKLNGKGAYKGDGAYYVVDKDNTKPVDGITVDDGQITLSKKVLSTTGVADTSTKLILAAGKADYGIVADDQEKVEFTLYDPETFADILKFKVTGTTATLYRGNKEGYEFTKDEAQNETIIFRKEDYSYEERATIEGLKSGLLLGTDEEGHNAIGTKKTVTGSSQKQFVAGLTYDSDANKITVTTDVLDATAGKAVTLANKNSGNYTLALAATVPTPDAGTGWKYTAGTGNNLATAVYKSGTQAGWKEGTGDDEGKKFTYQDAAYEGTTVATLTGLANNLKVSADAQTITNSSGKAAVYKNTDAEDDNYGKIMLTSYAFAKDNVTLKNADSQTYSLALFQGQTKQSDGTFKNDDGYVATSVTTKEWAKAANANKATYTINVPEGYNLDANAEEVEAGKTPSYDQRVIYIKPKKQVATLTGINSSLTVSADKTKILSGSTEAIEVLTAEKFAAENNEELDKDATYEYVLKMAPAAVNQAKVTLAKGDFILDFESTEPNAPVWNKAKDSTKATYTQSYAANSYELAADKMSIAYTKDRVDTLFTLDGLAKNLVATNSASITDSDGNVKISVNKDKPKTSTSSNGNVNADTEGEDETMKVVQLSDKSVINSGSTVKLTNGKVGTVTQDYRLWLGEDDTEDTTAFATGKYADSDDYGNKPMWSFDGKGTATLDEGTYEGWKYKEDKNGKVDYTNLEYVKPTKVITATIKGLNSDLVVYDNAICKKVSSGNPTELAVSLDETDNKVINLSKTALPATIKNNTKITLSLGKDSTGKVATYKLANDADNAITETSDEDSVWSVNKGTASYQYGTTAGWTFSDDKDTVTYTDAKTTLVAKISGIKKDETTFTGKADAKGKATDVPVSVEDMEEHISVEKSETADKDGNYTFTFTLKDADYLAGSKVTLTKADKKDTNTYHVVADASLAPYDFADGKTDHPAQWTVNGKNGSAKLTAGTSAGYSNLESTDTKYGTVVNYSKEKTLITYFTISGLLKDKDKATNADDLETQIVDNGAITYKISSDGTGDKVFLNDAAVLGTTAVSLTSGKKADRTAYAFKFDEDALAAAQNNSNIDYDKSVKLQAKGGTINLVETAAENKFALSTDGKKLNYNKKDTDTILATIKGLNKNLAVHDGSGTGGSELKGAIVTATTTKNNGQTTTTYGTEELVTFDGKYGDGTFLLQAGALNDSSITLTVNKKIDGDYKIELAEDIITSVDTGDWKNLTEWTFSKGTASYRNYDKGYYKASTKNEGGYDFVKETKGTTYATISGLNPDVDDDTLAEALAAFNEATSLSGGKYVGTITLDSSMLVTKDKNNANSGKAVTLKNSATKNATETNLKLDLDTDSLAPSMVSTFKADGSTFTNGKLTGTYSTGYSLASDTSITYLAKEKGNQLIASITGVTGNVTANNGTITLNANQLTGKSVTLTTTDLADLVDTDYKLSFTDSGREITPAEDIEGQRTNGWEVKNGKATFTGYVTAGYKRAASEMSITYNKAVGTEASGTKPAKPAVAMTISNVTAASGDSSSVTVSGGNDGKATTLSNGLIAVEFDGTNIVGSNEADTITLMKGASVKGGKGDDNITLSNDADVILYGNGDGNDIVSDFSSNDKIILTGGKLTSVTEDGSDAIVRVGTGSIKLVGAGSTTINIADSKGSLLSTVPTSSSDILLADNNYSMDAAALTDIVEPFKASYTPYDFEAGLDLVKKDSFAPAVTFTGNDKK